VKGQLVYAEGRIHTRKWEGQDGQPHSRTEVIANRVIFLDRRGMSPLPDEKMEGTGVIELEPAPLSDEKVEDTGVTELEPEDLPFD